MKPIGSRKIKKRERQGKPAQINRELQLAVRELHKKHRRQRSECFRRGEVSAHDQNEQEPRRNGKMDGRRRKRFRSEISEGKDVQERQDGPKIARKIRANCANQGVHSKSGRNPFGEEHEVQADKESLCAE